MRIAIDIGHNVTFDSGARGYKYEDDLNKAIGLKVIEYLGILGHTIINCTPLKATNTLDSLKQRVAAANRDNVDIYISIHNNSSGTGQARGVECLYVSQKELAKKVCDEISSLGFINRGAKLRNDLYVLNNTYAPAILIECAFVDNLEDMALVDQVGIDNIAKRIVKAITGQEAREPKYYVRSQRFFDKAMEVIYYKNRYFDICERLYINVLGQNTCEFETQYLTKEQCISIIEKLSADGLVGHVIEE